MKNQMVSSTAFQSQDTLEQVLRVLQELADSLKDYHKSVMHNIRALKDNISTCREIRRNRKAFTKQNIALVSSFKSFSEKDQVNLELYLYRKIKAIEEIAPSVIQNLEEENVLVFSRFLIREINKTIATFKDTQSKMAAILYPDNSELIESSPELQQKIVDAWGDLDDEY